MIQDGKKAVLLLENGTELIGKSCGAEGTVMGETVFITTMVGYQETLTDSAFYGKLVTQTFPLIGNYGVNSFDDEAEKTYASGYIMREWCEVPSNFRCEGDINDYLRKNNIIGIYDIDTRKLTKILREEGEMLGVITTEEYNKEELLETLKQSKAQNALDVISVKKAVTYKAENAKNNVAVLDFGVKKSMVEELNTQGCDVTVLPYDTAAKEILDGDFDGVFLPHGPESEYNNEALLATVKTLCEHKLPIAGVGLGHLVLALANGGTIRRLQYGHRGGNQPVIDLASGRTYVTSQNHGYVVEKMDSDIAETSFHNANDKTCEGLRYQQIPAMSVSFMPSDSFYTQWVSLMKREGK